MNSDKQTARHTRDRGKLSMTFGDALANEYEQYDSAYTADRRKAAASKTSGNAGKGDKGDKDKDKPAPKRRGPVPGTEKARNGGRAVAKKYGTDFYRAIGHKGGSTVAREYGSEFFADIGRKGGENTKERMGNEHYSEIGRKGGLSNKNGGHSRRGRHSRMNDAQDPAHAPTSHVARHSLKRATGRGPRYLNQQANPEGGNE